ncbi:MAG: DUF3379 family protein [Steroidobacteraceae bacterium]
MNCNEARELIGADPDTVASQLQAHLNDCPACRAYLADMVACNAQIRHALQFDPQPLQRATADRPAPIPLLSGMPPPIRRRARSRGLTITASLAAGLLVAFTLWLSRPSETLASEIVTHVEGEPDSWAYTEPIPTAQLAGVLNKSGVQLGPGMGSVVYASSCFFRGRFVPHLVVTTKSGPVTVMILTHEHVRARKTFNEDGYAGLLVPARNGSIAILSRRPMALEQPAAEVLRALEAANQPNAP